MKKERIVYFDAMRDIAIFLVIFNHLRGYLLYGISSGLKQWFYLALTMITRINVPLFFMISGALLLNRDENYKILFQNPHARTPGTTINETVQTVGY